MKVKCPRCKKTIEYSTDNKYRPFCSRRCKESDLFDWVKEDEPEEEESSEDAMQKLAREMFGEDCFPGTDNKTRH